MGRMVIALSERTRQILGYLLRVEKPVSARQIASHLGLSTAQVRYCLRYLGPWLSERGLALTKTPRVGVRVRVPSVQRRTLLAELQELEGYELALAPDERRNLLLLQLLTAYDPLPVDVLCERLGVSRTSAFRDLAFAREWLGARGLQVIAHRRRGALVEGEERLWREALLELLLSNLSQGVLVAACVVAEPRSIKQRAAGRSFLWEACDFLNGLNLRRAEQLVTSLEKRLHLVLVDEARVSLILCIGFVLLRVPVGRSIPTDEGSGELPADARQTEAVRGMMMEIERMIGQDLPAGEIRYLASEITKAVATGSISEGRRVSVKGATDSSALELATLLGREAAKYLHAGLLHDREFINCLALELSTPHSRWPTSPLLEDWPTRQANYAADPLHGFTRRMLVPVMESHDCVPNERLLASMTTHIRTALERLGRVRSRRTVWVICGAGVATARNLISRLNLRLPELEIVGLASAFELIREPQLVSGADAVISTVPLDGVAGVPLFHVSSLLTPQDVEKLRVALGLDCYEPGPSVGSSPGNGLSMAEVLSIEAIDRDAVASSWEEVVDLAGALLLEVGAIWPSYVEAMKDMIRLYGPYVVVAPGAALLHAGPEMGGKRLAMSLVVLREAVPFGHEMHDPVRLALAFSSIDYKTHVRAVGEAMKLLGEEDMVRSILDATSGEEILESVRQIASGE